MSQEQKTPEIVVVGSVAFDSIETPCGGAHPLMLGGSASYTVVAASQYAQTGLVGVVGEDFPDDYMEIFRTAGADLQGLQQVPGKTFHWSGVYEADMNSRRTLQTDLNVFADFQPVLPPTYCESPYLFLGNIAPALQTSVLDQMKAPKFILLDTMDLWINIAREELERVIKRVNMVIINEYEVRELTGKESLLQGAEEVLKMGPEYALIKKGEHGAFLLWKDGYLATPAWPIRDVVDPTGAGDTYAAGIIGTIAAAGNTGMETLRDALVNATVTAAYTCEDFGLDRLRTITAGDIARRAADFRRMLP